MASINAFRVTDGGVAIQIDSRWFDLRKPRTEQRLREHMWYPPDVRVDWKVGERIIERIQFDPLEQTATVIFEDDSTLLLSVEWSQAHENTYKLSQPIGLCMRVF